MIPDGACPTLDELEALEFRVGAVDVRQLPIFDEDPELPALYRLADVLVFPTLNDAFGLVLLEAMASGLAVIATDRSGAPHLIREGQEGHLVPIRDAAAIAHHLDHLRRHRDEARAMGRRGRARVLAGFTWAHYAERLLSAYASLLGRRRPRRLGAQEAQGHLR